jgi:hypothetical protein
MQGSVLGPAATSLAGRGCGTWCIRARGGRFGRRRSNRLRLVVPRASERLPPHCTKYTDSLVASRHEGCVLQSPLLGTTSLSLARSQ